MRRFLFVALVVVLLAALVGSIVWYQHLNSPSRLLARAELALEAKEFDRSLELAGLAIAKDPDNWRGYYVQARAWAGRQQYDEARKSLEEALQHGPPGVTVELALAEAYAMPGARALASPESGSNTAVLKDAIAHLCRAQEYLAGIHGKDEAENLDVQQTTARNLIRIGFAQLALSKRLEKDAAAAGLVSDTSRRDASRKTSVEAAATSERSLSEACRMLLDVMNRDPKRDVAARMLVEVAQDRKDQKTLDAAWEWVKAQKDPPPLVAAKLIVLKLVRTELQDEVEEPRQLAAAAQKLDEVLASHPAELEAKVARAEVAARLLDWGKAQALCSEVLNAKPALDQQYRAKFIEACALAAQNMWFAAEPKLYELRTRLPNAAKVQYEYAKAAIATGKMGLAREAMRKAADLAPGYVAPRRYLAELLLAEGLAAEAFADAKACYDARPDDPEVLALFVRAAKATAQDASAEQAIMKALQKCDPQLHDLLAGLPRDASPEIAKVAELKSSPAHPRLMMAAGAGYGELGKNSRSSAIMSRAAECKPVTVEEQLAVTEALAAMGRVSQAEKQLADEQARNPNDPRVVAGLARLYQATGRNLQSIEKYREAVRLDSHNVRYREGLARELLGGGLLDECTGECQAILGSDPTNAAALRMLNQIKLMRGNVGLDETFVRAGAGAPTGLPLAQVCLGTGRTEKCIEICLAELKKTPNNIEARSLLGFAYSLLGQNDSSAEQWKAALQGAPAQLIPYMQLADVLARSMKPEEVEAAIAAVPGAKRDWIDFAMAWLSDRAGQYDAAAETYGRVLARQDVSADTRNRVRALRAQVLCRAGRVEESMAELDRLAEIPGERISALFTKGALLAAMGRAKEADPILTGLQQLAVKNKNEVLLGRLISLQMDMRQTDKALAACNELEELLPGDPRPYVARAGVLAAADRLDEASECCRKAIERQPGDYRTRLTLARLLDVADKPIPAIEALRQLEAQGQAARCLALLEFGDMLSRWGLAAQAAEKYEQVAKQGYEGDPRLQLALANAFAQVGNKGRAREVIAKIPAYAPQYVAANLILVGLENAEEEKLQILRQVRKAKPGQPAVLVQEMSILVRANRPADVAKALQEYMADKAAAGALPEQACFLALQAMLLNQDSRAAAGLAVQMARGTRSPIWRQVAALLVIDVDPAAARSFIAGAAEAGPCDAMLGLVLASRTGQEAAPWKSRLDELQKSLSQLTPPRSIPARARFLAALAAGARAEAESELAKWTGAPVTDRQAAAELLVAAKEPNASAEAAELLKASVAADLGLPLMARDSAMKLLKARPACQWAAVLAGQCDADGLFSREILQTLQPADCLLAQTIRARLASKEKQYEKAAGIWWTVAAAEKDNPEILMDLGAALENAGRLEDALAVYRKVWETDRRPLAANNAAFLVSLLWPQDSAKLAEASRWMAEAVKAAPAGASFRDTLGWIAHLQGRDEEACLELRRAVKGLPDSPEVHYHLGVVEAAAGRTELASWHLAAAVNIGDRFKAEKRDLAPASQQAVRSAQEALARLAQSKP